MSHQHHSVFTLSLLQIGAFASIPPIMVGYMLASQYGILSAAFNILLGNFVVFLLSAPIGMQASKDGQTSADQVRSILGVNGNKVAMIGLLILLTSWFSLNINLVGGAILSFAQNHFSCQSPSLAFLMNIFIGCTVIYMVSKGINALKNFTKIFIVLFFTIIMVNLLTRFGVSTKANLCDIHEAGKISIEAICFIVACPIGQLFDLPTFHRFARSRRASLVSNSLVFLVFLPLVEMIGIILFIFCSQEPFILSWVSAQLPVSVQILNVFFLITSVCSIDNINLYVLSVNTASLLPKASFANRTRLIGAAAILLSFTPLLSYFMKALNTIVTIIAAILMLMIVRALSSTPLHQKAAIFALTAGILAGFLTPIILPNYNIPYLSAALSTLLVYLTFHALIITKRKKCPQ